MGRKNFNRRGKMGRRARARRATAAAPGTKVNSKFDAPPKRKDASVVSTIKRKALPGNRITDDDEVPPELTEEGSLITPKPSRKDERALLRQHGNQRKQQLRTLQKQLGVSFKNPERSVHELNDNSSDAISAEPEEEEDQSAEVHNSNAKRSEGIRRKRKAREDRLKLKKKKTIVTDEDGEHKVEKPKFGEVIESPSERIASLGKALMDRFKDKQKIFTAAYEKPNRKVKRSSDNRAD